MKAHEIIELLFLDVASILVLLILFADIETDLHNIKIVSAFMKSIVVIWGGSLLGVFNLAVIKGEEV
jgi:hypothetical protein